MSAPPWHLCCPWCEWYIIVNARGGRGNDQGSGVEAANLMQRHVEFAHQRSWSDFLAVSSVSRSAAGET